MLESELGTIGSDFGGFDDLRSKPRRFGPIYGVVQDPLTQSKPGSAPIFFRALERHFRSTSKVRQLPSQVVATSQKELVVLEGFQRRHGV